MKKAVFPGSFDPITLGHEDIITRAIPLFDEIIVAIGINADKKNDVDYIVRGLRNPADFEFEKAIAHTNRDLAPIETVFLLTAAKTSYISSSIVRDVLRNGGDVSSLVPSSVISKIDL